MGQIVNFGREMIRINSEKNRIEYSTNGGKSRKTKCDAVIKRNANFLCKTKCDNIECTHRRKSQTLDFPV